MPIKGTPGVFVSECQGEIELNSLPANNEGKFSEDKISSQHDSYETSLESIYSGKQDHTTCLHLIGL